MGKWWKIGWQTQGDEESFTHIHIHAHIHTHTCACTHPPSHAHKHVCRHTHTRMLTHIHTPTHAHTHTQWHIHAHLVNNVHFAWIFSPSLSFIICSLFSTINDGSEISRQRLLSLLLSHCFFFICSFIFVLCFLGCGVRLKNKLGNSASTNCETVLQLTLIKWIVKLYFNWPW